MTVTALYHDPERARTYPKADWVVVLAYPAGAGFRRFRFDTQAEAETFAADYPDARR